MKITAIRTVALPSAPPVDQAQQRRPSWLADGPVAGPMTPIPRWSKYRPSWTPTWPAFGCVIETDEGVLGLGTGQHGRPVAAVIEDYLGPRLVGEDALSTEHLYDLAVRLCAPFGAVGLASYAISAIDLALWDLKGKALEQPVYSLLGGPVREELECYATGGDADWYAELGFGGVKLPCRYGPADGPVGLAKNREQVAAARAAIGDDVDLMLDCWMAFDVEYAVRLATELRPYRVRWMEECLPSADLRSHAELRRRLPWQGLATGEHWFGVAPFQQAIADGLVDIVQPDINWVGGLTPLRRIAGIAEAAGVKVMPHAAGNSAYGQHACLGITAISWTEYFIGTPPGVPLTSRDPGVASPHHGRVRPTDRPGFGVDVDPASLPPFAG